MNILNALKSKFKWLFFALVGIIAATTGCLTNRRSPTAVTEPTDPMANPTSTLVPTAAPTPDMTMPPIMCYAPPLNLTIVPTPVPTEEPTPVPTEPNWQNPTFVPTLQVTLPDIITCYVSIAPTSTPTYEPTIITPMCYTPTVQPTPTNVAAVKSEKIILVSELERRGILSNSLAQRAKALTTAI